MAMQDFMKLRVWHRSVELAATVYRITSKMPEAERFGLTAQMRSAAVSISSNIAEGCGRPTLRDMARFLGIAIGSASEVESQLEVVRRLELLALEHVEAALAEVRVAKRQLIALHSRVAPGTAPPVEATDHVPPTTHNDIPL